METLAIEFVQVLESLEGVLAPLSANVNSEVVGMVARPEVALGFALLWLLLRLNRARPSPAGDSDEVLRRRLERGEISKETYEKIKNRTLEAGR